MQWNKYKKSFSDDVYINAIHVINLIEIIFNIE
jgi:hypothetical protein